jgi:4-hydroxy-tetrahydrodipicolinate synthase
MVKMENLSGVIPPMTTPFTENDEIDYKLLKADAKYLIGKAKVHGLAVGGSTGEGHTLTTEEVRASLEVVTKEAKGKVPVIAGVIVDSTKQAIERCKALDGLDISALQVTPVHSLFKPDDDAMYKHFKTISEAVKRPILIYNVVPWSYCSPQLLTRIITEVPGVVGVKQSASDVKLLANLILRLEDRGLIFTAVDALLYPSFALGAIGTICALATAVPEVVVDLWNQVQAGDHIKARKTHERLLAIWNTLDADNLPANTKTAMDLQGRKAGLPRPPMPASSEVQKAAIRKALKDSGVIR